MALSNVPPLMKAQLAALVLAYVMPTSGVLKRFAATRDDLSVTQLKATGVAAVAPVLAKDVASSLGVNWNSGELTLNASLMVRFPGRCRIDLSSPESTRTISVAVSSGKKRFEGGELAALGVALEQACALLALKSSEDGATREAVLKHLASMKVETKNVSLARLDGAVTSTSVSYLIGARDDGAPQLWVSKERFLPTRLRFNDGGTMWDVRFSDYTSQATGETWPRVLEISKGAEPQLRVMVLAADPKADLSQVKF